MSVVYQARSTPIRRNDVTDVSDGMENMWDGAVPLTVCFSIAAIIAGIFRSALDDDALPALNIGISLFILVFCVALAARVVLRSPGSLFTSFPWLYLTLGVFFGFGALSYYFAREATVMNIQEGSQYPINDAGIFISNYLNLCGIAFTGLGMLAGRLINRSKNVTPLDLMQNRKGERRIFYIFLALGLTVKIGVTLPGAMGISTVVLPSILQQLGLLPTAALMMGFIMVRGGARDLFPIVVALAVFEVGTSFLTASKTHIITSLMMLMVVDYATKPRPLRAGVMSVAILALYGYILSPLVLFMRGFSGGGATSVGSVFDAMKAFFEGTEPTTLAETDVQLWWARLTYNNYQAFGYDQYNAGAPGTSLNEVFYILMPRVFFPDKPAIGYGKQLSELLMPGSGEWVQTGMSIFAEGYWNIGYIGVFVVGFWMGLLLSSFSGLVTGNLRLGRLGYIFIAIGVMQMGMFISSWFAGTYFGGAALLLVYAIAIGFLFYWGRMKPAKVYV